MGGSMDWSIQVAAGAKPVCLSHGNPSDGYHIHIEQRSDHGGPRLRSDLCLHNRNSLPDTLRAYREMGSAALGQRSTAGVRSFAHIRVRADTYPHADAWRLR